MPRVTVFSEFYLLAGGRTHSNLHVQAQADMGTNPASQKALCPRCAGESDRSSMACSTAARPRAKQDESGANLTWTYPCQSEIFTAESVAQCAHC